MKIKAAVAHGVGEPFQIEEVELSDELLPNEILVKNVATGICHSDIAMRDLPVGLEFKGVEFLPKPVVLGHEGAGIVQKVGSEVDNLEPGDHVILSYHFCGECSSCETDLHPYCVDFLENNLSGKRLDGAQTLSSPKYERLSASYHQQSSFATYSIATKNNAVKVPKDLPLELLGPLGCGFLTGAGAVRNRIKPVPGTSISIFGCGPLGFAAMYMAKKMGCTQIIAVDLHENRLELAKEFGATHTVNASEVEDSVEEIKAMTGGMGANYAYECAGSVHVMSQAAACIAPLGTAIMCGVIADQNARIEVIPQPLQAGQSVGGIIMGHADMPGTVQELVEGVQAGEFPLEKLSKFYEFEQINEAMADQKSGKTLKAILRMPN